MKPRVIKIEGKNWITAEEFAKILKINKGTVWKWKKRGKITTTKLKGTLLVQVKGSDLEAQRILKERIVITKTAMAILTAVLVTLSAPWATAQGASNSEKHDFTIMAVVQSVETGDRLTLDLAGKPSSITLKGVAAPRLEQEQGREAACRTRALVQGKEVTAHISGFKGNAAIATVVYEPAGEDLARQLVLEGLAWVETECNEEKYLSAYAEAKKEKRGIWSAKSPTPPWTGPEEKQAAKEVPGISATGYLLPAVALAFVWMLFLAGKKSKKCPERQETEPQLPRPEKPITKLVKAYLKKKIEKPNTSKEEQ